MAALSDIKVPAAVFPLDGSFTILGDRDFFVTTTRRQIRRGELRGALIVDSHEKVWRVTRVWNAGFPPKRYRWGLWWLWGRCRAGVELEALPEPMSLEEIKSRIIAGMKLEPDAHASGKPQLNRRIKAVREGKDLLEMLETGGWLDPEWAAAVRRGEIT